MCVLFYSIRTHAQNIYYVDAYYGNDTYSGSYFKPYKTIQKAADIVNAGDTVIVKDGIYTVDTTGLLNKDNLFVSYCRKSGTALKWIVFKAEHKGKAIIDGQNYTIQYGFGFEYGVKYIELWGFEFRNMVYTGVDLTQVSNIKIVENNFHDIGRICTSTPFGHCGIYGYVADSIFIEKNLFHNIGRLALGENGCNNDTNNSSHDHGIYIEGGSKWYVKNNIFYDIKHGWGVHIYSGWDKRPTDILVVNNTFFDANPKKDGQMIIGYPGAYNVLVANNIFYQPNNYAIIVDGTDNTLIYGNVNFFNNITFPATGPGEITNMLTQGINISGNIVNVDPLLRKPLNYDASLLAYSPAIDKGMDLSSVNVNDDYIGSMRPLGGGYDIGAYEFSGGMLPLYLLSFNAIALNDRVEITWTTASNHNHTHFDIEKSINGKDFISIGKIEENSYSTDKEDYSYTDQWPANGTNFYRLKQTNPDGSFEYSNIVSIHYKNGESKVDIKITSPNTIEIIYKKSKGKALLYNYIGQKIFDSQINEGRNIIKINKFYPGVYCINIDNKLYKIYL